MSSSPIAGPNKLEPKFVERPWGKHDLAPLYPPQTKRIGEVWFENGALLIKFLFTTEKLSVQVHPEDPYAAAHHNGSAGKTEMWHILAAEPGSKIALGFDKTYTAAEVKPAAESGAIMNMLRWIEAKPGETYFVPAGTVHALGEGFTVCEIQQTSDITYRMFDYNRGRELHLDRAMDVSRLEPYDTRQPSGDRLAGCNYFVTDKLRWRGRAHYVPTRGARDEAIIILSGTGTIAGQSYTAGEVWRPGHEPVEIDPSEPSEIIRTYVPAALHAGS
jgi:mannose-6-phosphate isomerase